MHIACQLTSKSDFDMLQILYICIMKYGGNILHHGCILSVVYWNSFGFASE